MKQLIVFGEWYKNKSITAPTRLAAEEDLKAYVDSNEDPKTI